MTDNIPESDAEPTHAERIAALEEQVKAAGRLFQDTHSQLEDIKGDTLQAVSEVLDDQMRLWQTAAGFLSREADRLQAAVDRYPRGEMFEGLTGKDLYNKYVGAEYAIEELRAGTARLNRLAASWSFCRLAMSRKPREDE